MAAMCGRAHRGANVLRSWIAQNHFTLEIPWPAARGLSMTSGAGQARSDRDGHVYNQVRFAQTDVGGLCLTQASARHSTHPNFAIPSPAPPANPRHHIDKSLHYSSWPHQSLRPPETCLNTSDIIEVQTPSDAGLRR